MIKIRTLKSIGDVEFGYLSFFEVKKEIDFEIKRIYYSYGVPVNIKRGNHAHKQLKQALWCPYGKIEVFLYDGENEENVILDSPEKLLVVDKGIWHHMIWLEENSVLCVAASDYYDESDYIRNYDSFIDLAKGGYWK